MAEPLTTAELKAHCRVVDSSEDDLIDSYGVAAREWVEEYTGVLLVQAVVTDAFPEWGEGLTLRNQPITVDDPTPTLTVTYVEDGADVEYADRVIRDETYPWVIEPAFGTDFPTQDEGTSITVEYTAGYASAADVPERYKQAIRVLVAAMHQSRGSISEDAARTARWILNRTPVVA